MGITTKSLELIVRSISRRKIELVCDLGSQNSYFDEYVRSGMTTFPFFSEWWRAKGIQYMCIDLCGENEAMKWDLSLPLPTSMQFDLICDFGTSEHVSDLYECMKNVHDLCKVGGLIIHENPKKDNWPLHCFHYRTMDFYTKLAQLTGNTILELGEVAAMGNYETGNNVFCVMQKNSEQFISKEQMPEYYSK